MSNKKSNTNTLTILSLNTPFQYVVQSVHRVNGTNEYKEYLVNTSKKTCTCPYGQHKSHSLVEKPCKHLMFCLKVEMESMLKNYIHFHLVSIKKLDIAKITKVTRIVKGGKETKIVAASYVLANGNHGCQFVNTVDIKKERYFEIYETVKNLDGSRTMRVSISDKIVSSSRFNFGNQFDLVFKDGGYTKETYGEAGKYTGFMMHSIYDAMTSFLLPVDEQLQQTYLEYLERVINKIHPATVVYADHYFQYNGIQLWGFRNKARFALSTIKSITFDNAQQLKQYKASR